MKQTSKIWQIHSSAGLDLGMWEAATREDAIRQLNADAGCEDSDRDDGLTVTEVPRRKLETVKIARRLDAEGRATYTYARHGIQGLWLAPVASAYCYSSIAAATRAAMEDGFKVDRRGILEF